MFRPIPMGFAAALALATIGASFAQVVTGAGTATDGSASTGQSAAPSGAMGGPAASNPDAPQPVPGQANSNPSPVTRNHNDCNKANCVDNPGGG